MHDEIQDWPISIRLNCRPWSSADLPQVQAERKLISVDAEVGQAQWIGGASYVQHHIRMLN